ncbi:hypothetical protein GCM10025858_18950 [Alicyclobacillus sacchari]|uniref:ABC transporter substrate-binding protein n=1 Tax=Alicyclobacillus sacchari TaxID=392010 RepID=UPI0023E90AE8|nr:extracellular solute-binding protein [Alicyclobacillus sacchari]GMA57392.1 hypothetical protein GCM10025858_18950 [Alicyclobacillus sacchari]
MPNAQTEVNIFEKYYPNIKVKLVNAGAGSTEYQKFSTVVQAGSGIPDVVMLEFDMMPQYISTGALQDISKYVGNLKSKFSPWTWSEVSMGGGVYGIPEDTGPMGLFYQTSLFKKYNLAVPTTWAQFEQEALVFHKKIPSSIFLISRIQMDNGCLGCYGRRACFPFKVQVTTGVSVSTLLRL